MNLSDYNQLEFRCFSLPLIVPASEFTIFDKISGVPVGVIDWSYVKLKEEVRIFSNQERTTELACVQARQVRDYAATYDAFDSRTNEHLFSMWRPSDVQWAGPEVWSIMDADEQEFATLHELNQTAMLLRRWGLIFGQIISRFIPRNYELVDVNGRFCASLTYNPVRRSTTLMIAPTNTLDARIPVVAAAHIATAGQKMPSLSLQ